MRHKIESALSDALSAGLDIQRFTSGFTLDDYARDRMTQAAVERKFEIIGAALSRVKKADPKMIAVGFYYQRFIDFGDVISHSVEAVDNRTIWQTVERELPILIGELRRLIESE